MVIHHRSPAGVGLYKVRRKKTVKPWIRTAWLRNMLQNTNNLKLTYFGSAPDEWSTEKPFLVGVLKTYFRLKHIFKAYRNANLRSDRCWFSLCSLLHSTFNVSASTATHWAKYFSVLIFFNESVRILIASIVSLFTSLSFRIHVASIITSYLVIWYAFFLHVAQRYAAQEDKLFRMLIKHTNVQLILTSRLFDTRSSWHISALTKTNQTFK